MRHQFRAAIAAVISPSPRVELVEVGPRDGFQSIEAFIPTDLKATFLRRLVAAGLRRIEIGSFVSPSAVPQLRDTRELILACQTLVDIEPQVLVANKRRGEEAVSAGVRRLVFVLSVSEKHNKANVRRLPSESMQEYEGLVAAIPADIDIRVDVATAFDCPYAGRIPEAETVSLLDRIINVRADAEICLCDTTGRVTPDQVGHLYGWCLDRYAGKTRWAFHAHDTYGLGLANILSAWRLGVTVFDASVGGIGGCPFAPGATGNVATEDVAWMFERMGVSTGIDIERLIPVANDAAQLPGAIAGGRIRDALLSSCAASVSHSL